MNEGDVGFRVSIGELTWVNSLTRKSTVDQNSIIGQTCAILGRICNFDFESFVM